VQPGENADPIGDHTHSPVAGIVHRYPDRVLFKLVHVCAVYCRFCFRREMVGPGKATALSSDTYRGALDYIREHREIWEVILTGGDPLMLSPRRLAEIMADLAAIDHVRIIRIHTRVPVVDPTRISAEMVAALKVKGAATWVALHANHARELTDKARAACAGMIDAGTTNQASAASSTPRTRPGVVGSITQNQAAAEDSDAPVVKLVNLIIAEAISLRASDIHIEPFRTGLVVRLRVDDRHLCRASKQLARER